MYVCIFFVSQRININILVVKYTHIYYHFCREGGTFPGVTCCRLYLGSDVMSSIKKQYLRVKKSEECLNQSINQSIGDYWYNLTFVHVTGDWGWIIHEGIDGSSSRFVFCPLIS
jgi:predicted ATPase